MNLFTTTGADETSQLNGYHLIFSPYGKITAQKNGEIAIGNWSEDEIEKKIAISFNTQDPVLEKLNNNWDISTATNTSIQLKDTENSSAGRLQITSL